LRAGPWQEESTGDPIRRGSQRGANGWLGKGSACGGHEMGVGSARGPGARRPGASLAIFVSLETKCKSLRAQLPVGMNKRSTPVSK
jgi:hypothetical protein